MEEVFISKVISTLKRFFGWTKDEHSARADAVRQTIVRLRHEINNPLTVVLGNAELILMKGDHLPAETRLRLESIVKSGLKIKDAVADLSHAVDDKRSKYTAKAMMIDIQDSKRFGDADYAP